MPLVLTSSQATASGHAYEDITGVSYEYPLRYRNVITTGERFIYYRGRQQVGGGRQPQVYFGAGVIGIIRDSPHSPDCLVCDVLDYQPFDTPVYFRSSDGRYLEAGGDRLGYYQPGVRRISEDEYAHVLDVAARTSTGRDSLFPPAKAKGTYASPQTAGEIEAYSLEAAQAYLLVRFPSASFTVQHHSNPGFDIRVDLAGHVNHYVEVKGTQSTAPRFYLSEGERLFSVQHANEYLLIVVFAINLARRIHEIYVHHGPISDEQFHLSPVQWSCTVRGK